MFRRLLLSVALQALWLPSAIAQDNSAVARNHVTSIDHLVINVTDMERALAFYKKIGFALMNEDGWRNGQGQVSIKIGENQKINVHRAEGLEQVRPQTLGADDRFGLALIPVAGGADFCLVWNGTLPEVQEHLRASAVESVGLARQVAGARGPATSTWPM